MEHIIRTAEARLQAARQEVFRLENFLATYRELAGQAGKPQHVVVSRGLSVNSAPGMAAVTTGKMTETERAAKAIIAENGAPVPSALMLTRLTELGIEVGGKEPLSTLSARLSRAPSLRFERGMGWTLRSATSQKDEAADPALGAGEPAASDQPPNHAVKRGEVEHHNMTN